MGTSQLESGNFSALNTIVTTLQQLHVGIPYPALDGDTVDGIRKLANDWADKALSATSGIPVLSWIGLSGPDDAQRPYVARVQNEKAMLSAAVGDRDVRDAAVLLIKDSDTLLSSVSVNKQNEVNGELWSEFTTLSISSSDMPAPSMLSEVKPSLVSDIADDFAISGRAIVKGANAVGNAAGNILQAAKDEGNKIAEGAKSIFGDLEIVVLVAGGLGVLLVGAIIYAIVKNPGRVKESAQAATAVKGVFR